jgi:hypothetical protein
MTYKLKPDGKYVHDHLMINSNNFHLCDYVFKYLHEHDVREHIDDDQYVLLCGYGYTHHNDNDFFIKSDNKTYFVGDANMGVTGTVLHNKSIENGMSRECLEELNINVHIDNYVRSTRDGRFNIAFVNVDDTPCERNEDQLPVKQSKQHNSRTKIAVILYGSYESMIDLLNKITLTSQCELFYTAIMKFGYYRYCLWGTDNCLYNYRKKYDRNGAYIKVICASTILLIPYDRITKFKRSNHCYKLGNSPNHIYL